MPRNILKFNSEPAMHSANRSATHRAAFAGAFFAAGAAILTLALFITVPQQALAATKPAITLKNGDEQFPVTQTDASQWKSATQQPSTFISFEPQKNSQDYILGSLGLQNNATSEITYDNYNVAKIYQYLKSVEPAINQDSHDATFKMDDDTVTDFDPGTNGQDLDIKNSIEAIKLALDNKSDTADLIVNQTFPQNKLSDTNNLGINELIAHGDSNFSGSPANRIWNIKVGAQKETGTLIKPGEEFSFNKYLGPVDGEHGYKPELVIKGGEGTIPEFGGGLCQVSTTAFRAAANAGFPITARRNHSYAVQYYAPQGTDATIYPGVQDMKFINDTTADILIWPSFPAKNILRFSIYGTKDGRQVAFEGPTVYDRKPDGSLKATWTRIITEADGTKKTDVFNSNYQSPALFHKVVEFPPPVPPTGTPPTNTVPGTPTPQASGTNPTT